ncbi:MAG: response regulator, partial [Synechococcales cyanobacterium RU_4_20]|nr:response regulator [Synechococcales cyanobacterium RU_4_20]
MGATKGEFGTGLGLSISRTFVQLMGGELWATSKMGQGSRFQFTLPLQPVESKVSAVPRPNRVVALRPASKTAGRILVADDLAFNRKLLYRLLSEAGFEVREADNGAAAVFCWDLWQPDLVLMDMRMPVLDGYEATRQIRELEALRSLPPTPIIATSAGVLPEELEAALKAGCTTTLPKPFQQ